MIVLCLKHGSKMKDFCLKEGQGLMATEAHLYPNFPPDLPPPNPNRLMQRANSGFDFLNHYWANKLAYNSLYR